MLVLTRKEDEEIVIGEGQDEITITVLKIQGSEKVSIGIKAHPNTPIFRKELLAKGNERRKRKDPASKTTPQDIERLIEAVQISTEIEENKKNMINSSNEYNCYLP
ncbi:MAG: carbon storage regulator [Parachlamydiales bacterium]|jgi:carbon storage regulator CsrA